MKAVSLVLIILLIALLSGSAEALLGSSVRFSQSSSSLVRKTARATLMPPAVEPAQPPMTMKTDVISRAACDQSVIVVDCNPVGEMADASETLRYGANRAGSAAASTTTS